MQVIAESFDMSGVLFNYNLYTMLLMLICCLFIMIGVTYHIKAWHWYVPMCLVVIIGVLHINPFILLTFGVGYIVANVAERFFMR